MGEAIHPMTQSQRMNGELIIKPQSLTTNLSPPFSHASRALLPRGIGGKALLPRMTARLNSRTRCPERQAEEIRRNSSWPG